MRSRPPAVQRYRDAFAERDLVQELEGMVARAWAPLTVLDVGGWELRSAGGFSRLANSVRPRSLRGDQPLAARLTTVERFYAARGLPARYQISAATVPRDLDRVLAGEGYGVTSPVEVRTPDIEHLAGLGTPEAGDAVVAEGPPARWVQAWVDLTDASPTQVETLRGLLRRARVRAAYALLDRAGEHAAVARGVLHGGWLGIDYLTAAPEHRDAAAGAALAGALGRWAQTAEAVRAYVHLDPGEPAAGALGAALRGPCAFSYRFRVRDPKRPLSRP